MQLDSYIHTHFGETSEANLGNKYSGLHLINLHSISLYNTFINIGSYLNNNQFYYNSLLAPITIPDGCYSLISFNKYLASSVTTELYRVVLSYDGTHYDVCSYLTVADRTNDVKRTVQTVYLLSKLNSEIYDGLVWCDQIKMYCNLISNGDNVFNQEQSSNVQSNNYVVVPIQVQPYGYQLFSYNQEFSFEFTNRNLITIYFTRTDETKLRFIQTKTLLPKIQFTFIEGYHQ